MGKILRAGARGFSFQEAADALDDLADLKVSSRQLTRIAEESGRRMEAERDDQVRLLNDQQLTPAVTTRPALAVVQVDGGRLGIRSGGIGPGAHNGAWREDKIALLATAAIKTSETDPEPELPDCFRDRQFVEGLVHGISGHGPLSSSDPPAENAAAPPPLPADREGNERTRPELLVRTYVASMCPSEEFGPMVAAEARGRNFENATRRVFVGDGSAWIWKLQKRHFPAYHAVLDFLHALGHVYAAAKAAAPGLERRWALFQSWSEACWRGRVDQVVEALRALAPLTDGEVDGLADDDPRRTLVQERGYLERNRPRMDYPNYRRQGLPWTSSHVESTVKVFNRRVKGSEKFWGEPGAEAILQLRAAFLSEDGRLSRHLKTRPCSPFRTYKTREIRKAA
jgi:hypothetical protein